MNSAAFWHFFVFFTTRCASTALNDMHICYVLPRGASNSSCPVDLNPCFDINNYVQHISKYFVSNTTFIFLPGTHILDIAGLFNVQNIDNLKLIGNSSSQQSSVFEDSVTYNFTQYDDDSGVTYLESLTNINCTGSSGFLFFNIINLQIINLTITNCGLYSPQTTHNAAMHLLNISNFGMKGVTIKNSTGYGILGINIIGNSAIEMSSFIGNNQLVKYYFQNESIPIKCNNNDSATNTIYKNSDSSSCSLNGGNIYIMFKDPAFESSNLFLSYLVLSLGVDGSYPNCTNPTPGTGLALSITQQSFTVHVIINNTVSYRNQGQFGANFYFEATSYSNVSLYNSTSKLGVSKYGSVYYYAIPSSNLTTCASTFVIKNSTLECNYAWLCGSLYINIPENAIHHVDIHLWNSIIVDDRTENVSSLLVNGANENLNVYVTSSYFKILQLKNYGRFNFIGKNKTQLIIDNSTHFMYTELYCELVNILVTNSTFNFARGTLIKSSITLNGAVLFANVITHSVGGALFLISSKLIVKDFSVVQFVNNKAYNGGALFMDSLSTINFFPHSNMSFIKNVALLYGGAIYIEDASAFTAVVPANCFFQFSGKIGSEIDVHMYFEGNYAVEAGSVLYGGNVDNCVLDCSNMPPQYHSTCAHSPGKMFDIITYMPVGLNGNSTSLIASDPTTVCFCNTSNPRVCLTQLPTPVVTYPGQYINVSCITLGQRNGIVPGIVHIWYEDSSIVYHSPLTISSYCDVYSIKVRPSYGPYKLYLSTEQAFNTYIDFMNAIYINIVVQHCPIGFSMDNSSGACVCNELLQRHHVMCNINDQSISFLSGSMWVGRVPSRGIGVIGDCPFDYCNVSRTIYLQQPDLQCQQNRSDIICGRCQVNQSMMLGSSKCTSACTNTYLLLLIPFAIMGVALVGFLLVFDFTVTNGTINIFILYAFIIRLNAYLFFSPSCNPVMKILEVFIAWLNLDLGIETCFYENMESIGKVWLQFAFSFYVSAIIGAIVLAGRISTKISRLCRYRIVPVIATLILLFYSKMLRTVLIIFNFQWIDISKGTYLIWMYDGSKEYLANKSHIGLFIVGLLVTIFFIIPYTLLLLLTPYLMKLSHWRVFSWINRIKPLVDSYEAPFKDRYRFWTGAMLSYRIALAIVSTYFSQQPTMILLMIIIVHAGIVFSGFAVYKSWVISGMETLLHVNIIINSMAIYFLNLADIDFPSDFHIGHCLPSTISVGVSFLCFLVIIFRNTFKPLLLWMKMKIGGVQYFQGNTNTEYMPALNNEIFREDQEYREPLMNE